MKLKNIQISNFKTFDYLNLSLENLNVLVGANASGKSNLLDSFSFIKDCLEKGIETACLQRGDIDNILNKRNQSNILSFKVDIDLEKKNFNFFYNNNFLYLFRPNFFEYSFELQKTGRIPKVSDESLNYFYTFYQIDPNKFSSWKEEIEALSAITKVAVTRQPPLRRRLFQDTYYRPRMHTSRIRVIIDRIINKAKISPDLQEFEIGLSVIAANKPITKILGEVKDPEINKALNNWTRDIHGFDFYFEELERKGKNLLAKELTIRDIPTPWTFFSRIAFYDLDPKLIKESAPISSLNELTSRGENLAPLMKYIYAKDKFLLKNIFSILSTFIPFFEKFVVGVTDEKKFILKLKESGIKKAFPAYLMSDGTANITALLVALLYNEMTHFICIEEPEKDIHPLILSKLIEVFRELSEDKQIMITTHSPDLVKSLHPDEVLFVDRNREGHTRIIKASANKDIEKFLENFSLDELWLSGYMVKESTINNEN
jgi:predicted ATPase